MARRFQYNELVSPTLPPIPSLNTWFNPLSEPVRQKPPIPIASMPAVFQELSLTVISINRWMVPLTEPVRIKPPVPPGALLHFVTDTSPPVRDRMSWFFPLSEPVRIKAPLPSGAQPSSFFALQDVPPFDRWYSTLSEPVRVKSPLPAAEQLSFVGDYQVIPVSIEHWFNPLSDPVRTKSNLSVANYQSIVDYPPLAQCPQCVSAFQADSFQKDSFQICDCPEPDKWMVALSEPVRSKAPAPVSGIFVLPVTVPTVEVVTVDKWFRQLAEPVRTKPPLNQSLYFCNDTVLISVPVYRWFNPLSEPTRVKSPLPSGAIPFLSYVTLVIPTEVVTLDKWYQKLSEPVLVKRPIIDYPSFFEDIATSFRLNSFWPSWMQPLSEPVRLKAPLTVGAYLSFLQDIRQPSLNEMSRWYAPLSEPVRVKQPLAVGAYPYFVLVVPVETILLDKWWRQLSEPTRTKVPLAIGAEPNLFYTVLDIPIFDKWFAQLSEPQRSRFPLSSGAIPSFTFDLRIPIPLLDKYWRMLSEPVRLGVSRTPSLIASGTQIYPFPFPPIPVSQTFWQPQLSIPVITKLYGLAALIASGETSIYPFPVFKIFRPRVFCVQPELTRFVIAPIPPFVVVSSIQVIIVEQGDSGMFQVLKDPDEVRDYEFDWSKDSGSDTIISSLWTLDPGLTKVSDSITSNLKATVIRLSGGTVPNVYNAVNRITWSSGQVFEKTLQVTIQEK